MATYESYWSPTNNNNSTVCLWSLAQIFVELSVFVFVCKGTCFIFWWTWYSWFFFVPEIYAELQTTWCFLYFVCFKKANFYQRRKTYEKSIDLFLTLAKESPTIISIYSKKLFFFNPLLNIYSGGKGMSVILYVNWKPKFFKELLKSNPLTDSEKVWITSNKFRISPDLLGHNILKRFLNIIPEILYSQCKVGFLLPYCKRYKVHVKLWNISLLCFTN